MELVADHDVEQKQYIACSMRENLYTQSKNQHN